ncbi:MAG: hypothetical protein QM704_05860 [Anaeromyxobacteraceae bacterium]
MRLLPLLVIALLMGPSPARPEPRPGAEPGAAPDRTWEALGFVPADLARREADARPPLGAGGWNVLLREARAAAEAATTPEERAAVDGAMSSARGDAAHERAIVEALHLLSDRPGPAAWAAVRAGERWPIPAATANDVGVVLHALGLAGRAWDAFALARASSPRSALVAENQGWAALAMGDPGAARARFEEAARLAPGRAGPRQGLAVVALQVRDADGARGPSRDAGALSASPASRALLARAGGPPVAEDGALGALAERRLGLLGERTPRLPAGAGAWDLQLVSHAVAFARMADALRAAPPPGAPPPPRELAATPAPGRAVRAERLPELLVADLRARLAATAGAALDAFEATVRAELADSARRRDRVAARSAELRRASREDGVAIAGAAAAACREREDEDQSTHLVLKRQFEEADAALRDAAERAWALGAPHLAAIPDPPRRAHAEGALRGELLGIEARLRRIVAAWADHLSVPALGCDPGPGGPTALEPLPGRWPSPEVRGCQTGRLDLGGVVLEVGCGALAAPELPVELLAGPGRADAERSLACTPGGGDPLGARAVLGDATAVGPFVVDADLSVPGLLAPWPVRAGCALRAGPRLAR